MFFCFAVYESIWSACIIQAFFGEAQKTERKKTSYWATIEKVQQELRELKQCQATFMDDCQKEELLKKQREDL